MNTTYALDAKYSFRDDNTAGYTPEQRRLLNERLNARMAAFREIEGEEVWFEALKFNSERILRDFDTEISAQPASSHHGGSDGGLDTGQAGPWNAKVETMSEYTLNMDKQARRYYIAGAGNITSATLPEATCLVAYVTPWNNRRFVVVSRDNDLRPFATYEVMPGDVLVDGGYHHTMSRAFADMVKRAYPQSDVLLGTGVV